MGSDKMSERLGNVLYWAGCIVAGLLAACGFAMLFDGEPYLCIVIVSIALVTYGIGRGCRHMLAQGIPPQRRASDDRSRGPCIWRPASARTPKVEHTGPDSSG